ncbi:hypothetical protein BDU57DRAFT_16106 [Ampelomyces quisqualis]|uniref:Rhodopsin domain-containing protein n=1 Tax=Ampelomyces quisqualis TaxID=50730 RepID=A0A6A5QXI1_AMPQU|nr:hypothetical protein BDU57DRAFT_16106 [Ampelomyces quisqualis]
MTEAGDDLPAFLAEDMGSSIIATSSVMIVLCTVFVGLRYYARHLASMSFSAQDVIILFAWLAEMGLCVNGIMMVNVAYTGRHKAYIVTVDPNKMTEHFKGVMISEVLHPAAVALPKLLVVLLYLPILTNKYERVMAKALIALISATWFSYTLAAVFQCQPYSFNWDKPAANRKCFNVQGYANISSVPNIITDLTVLILPLRTIWILKLSVGRRVGLLIIFLAGSVGIIASIIRTIVFARTLAAAGPLVDSTWNHVALVNWTTLEPGIYFLSACSLSFKPLFCMLAKTRLLQAFITHSKSTFRPGTSTHTTKHATQSDVALESMPGALSGRLTRLSEGRERSGVSKRMEVLVTTAVDVEWDEDWGASEEMRVGMRRQDGGNVVS